MRGLFIGRFQPMHLGHLYAIKHALEKCDELIVLVGSSQACYEVENPLTVGERIEMIHQVLEKEGIYEKCMILSIPDIKNNALWVSHVNSLVPSYDVVFSNNPLTIKLFEDSGKEVKKTPMFERSHYEGTNIRKFLLTGDKWKKLVPKEVVKFIKERKIVERVKAVSDKDKVKKKK